jgi:DNA-directed RNA polymerase subunit A'
VALYFKDNIKAKVPKRHRQRSQNKSKTSQQQRLIKKRGHVRGSMLAKRVDFSGRSVLSPDPNLRPNEIGLPRIVCKELTVSEIVDESNYVQLLRAVRNGPEVYPGANAVILESGDVIDLRYINRYKFQLRYGMIVERHLIDGDEVGGTCAARACKRAGPFPPSTPQVILSAARAALKPMSGGRVC